MQNCEYLADQLNGVTCGSAQQIVDNYAIIGNYIENHLSNM